MAMTIAGLLALTAFIVALLCIRADAKEMKRRRRNYPSCIRSNEFQQEEKK